MWQEEAQILGLSDATMQALGRFMGPGSAIDVRRTARAQIENKYAQLDQLSQRMAGLWDPREIEILNNQIMALQAEIAQLEDLAENYNYMSNLTAERGPVRGAAAQYGLARGNPVASDNPTSQIRHTQTGYGPDRFANPNPYRQGPTQQAGPGPRINLGYGAQGRTGY